MIKIKLFCLSILLTLTSCSKDKTEIKFDEIKNNFAKFDVSNFTNKDLKNFTIEITYFSANKSIVKVDTVFYNIKKENVNDSTPFLKASLKTFIIQRLTKNSTSVKARLLNTEYLGTN